MTFNVGDRVVIAKSSEYYGFGTFNNPSDVVGTVVSYYDEEQFEDKLFTVYVEWDNFYKNCYGDEDLINV